MYRFYFIWLVFRVIFYFKINNKSVNSLSSEKRFSINPFILHSISKLVIASLVLMINFLVFLDYFLAFRS